MAHHPRIKHLQAVLWALCGAVVLAYIFFAAVSGTDPSEALPATIVVLVLAALWLAHSWRRLWREENLTERGERKRRGF